MRNRTTGINVRVNENEKKRLQKNAKKVAYLCQLI